MSITLPYGCKPSKVVSTEATRPLLQHGHLVEHDGSMWLCAIDSCCAVALKVEGEAEPGFVPLPVLKALEAPVRKKRQAREIEQVSATVWRVTDVDQTVTYDFPKLDPGKIPKYADLGMWEDREGGYAGWFGFNAELLNGVAQALGCPRTERPIRLVVDGPLKSIQVVVNGAEETHRGLLMPMRLLG